MIGKPLYYNGTNSNDAAYRESLNTAKVNYILKREPHLSKTFENITDTIIGYFKRGDNITFETYGCEITFKFK